jgi:hypothetical protein
VSKTLTEIIKTTTQETYDEGFAAGRAYQAGKDEKVVNDWAYVSGLADKDLLIAALDEAGKGE